MTLKELKKTINIIPKHFDDYEITTSMSDYDVEMNVVNLAIVICMENKVINIHIKR